MDRSKTDVDDKPVIRCLVAFRFFTSDYHVKRGDPVTLAEALEWSRLGWEVMPDPFDQEELTRWEQMHRSKKWNKW